MPVIRSCHMTSELFIDSLQSVRKFHDHNVNYTEFQELLSIKIRVDFSYGAKRSKFTGEIFLILICDQVFFFTARGRKKTHA